MRELNKLQKIIGEIPYLYRRDTIYVMCVEINALIDAVNVLATELMKLEKRIDSIKESD